MYISKIIIKGFRAFDSEGVTISYKNKLNAFIGLNSSGKTAALQALSKVFSLSNKERELYRSDFHISNEELPNSVDQKDLQIEIQFQFNPDDDEAIPHFFDKMVIDNEGSEPYIRIRLESTWTKNELSEDGIIESNLVFLNCPEGDEEEDHKAIFSNHLKGLIQVFYVPAIRQPSEQIRFTSGSIFHRVLRNIDFNSEFKAEFENKIQEINESFGDIDDFNEIQSSLTKYWEKFHKDERYSKAELGFGGSDLDSILKKLEISFSPTETNRSFGVNELGEGYRSMFYLTLICSLLEIEEKLAAKRDKIRPVLTVLCIEEPENHIAPQLLGRVIRILESLSSQDSTQVCLSSHTPAIIKRVDPESIFHFRINEKYAAQISSILLPKKSDEAYKFIKEAVRNYPEIYFAKVVVIGEGDSEEVLFNRLMETLDVNFDENSVTFAPLGHRFVNHIWKLLECLNIPYITLLDLDAERNGGGWGRVKYILKQLLNKGVPKEELLELEDGQILSDEKLEKMHTWEFVDDKLDGVLSWINLLKKYDVFYSQPLDLDFLMLESFPDEYKALIPDNGGPKIPNKNEDTVKYNDKVQSGIKATLKSEQAKGSTYTDEQKELMIWYNYHFLGRGKPTTHICALANIDDETLKNKAPEVFKEMFNRLKEFT